MDAPPRTVTVPVNVPQEVEERALQRAIRAGKLEKFEEYLLDELRFKYEFNLSEAVEQCEFLRSSA